MRYTIIGRNIYAIGGNIVVARLAGLPIVTYPVGAYAPSGASAAGVETAGDPNAKESKR